MALGFLKSLCSRFMLPFHNASTDCKSFRCFIKVSIHVFGFCTQIGHLVTVVTSLRGNPVDTVIDIDSFGDRLVCNSMTVSTGSPLSGVSPSHWMTNQSAETENMYRYVFKEIQKRLKSIEIFENEVFKVRVADLSYLHLFTKPISLLSGYRELELETF